MSKPLRWFSFTNCDRTNWRVDLTCHDDTPDLHGKPGTRGYAGLTDCTEKSILIDADPKRNVQDYILLHELMHAALDGVEGFSGKTEEKVVEALAPRLLPILKQFGLRWPERPENVGALEKRARRKK